MHERFMAVLLLIAWAATAAPAPGASGEAVRGTLTRTRTVTAGTPAYGQIHRFMLAHPDRDRLWPTKSLQPPPFFTVTTHMAFAGRSGPPDEGSAIGSPVNLPLKGHDGDSVVIATCVGQASQKWTYAWAATGQRQASWRLDGYAYRATSTCGDPPPR